MSVDIQLAALLLEQTSYFQKTWIEKQFSEAFPHLSEADFRKAFSDFEGDGSLIGFDLESDGLDGALFQHEEHGNIEMKELFLVTGDETYYSIGSSFPIRLYRMKSAIMEAAIDAGLSDAARLLRQLPIDSANWTGVSPSFAFDSTAKSKVIQLIKKARVELSAASVSNERHAKADAYLDCALLLAEQPDPDPDLIAELLKRALLIFSGVGLLADLNTIFGSE